MSETAESRRGMAKCRTPALVPPLSTNRRSSPMAFTPSMSASTRSESSCDGTRTEYPSCKSVRSTAAGSFGSMISITGANRELTDTAVVVVRPAALSASRTASSTSRFGVCESTCTMPPSAETRRRRPPPPRRSRAPFPCSWVNGLQPRCGCHREKKRPRRADDPSIQTGQRA